MLGDVVGVIALGDLGVQHPLLGRAPGAGDAGGEVDDDLVRVDHPGPEQRQDAVDAGRRVAAGARHQPRGADRVAVELGQPVDRLGLQVERQVRMAVPVLVDRRVAQPEVGREVDDLEVARQLRHHLLGRRVRQGAEGEVDPRPVHRLDGGRAAAGRGGAGAGRPRPCGSPPCGRRSSRRCAAPDAWRSAAPARRRCSRSRPGSRRRGSRSWRPLGTDPGRPVYGKGARRSMRPAFTVGPRKGREWPVKTAARAPTDRGVAGGEIGDLASVACGPPRNRGWRSR